MIRRILAHIIANAAALYLVTLILEENFLVTGSWKGYLIAGVLFGLLNGILKPILKIISLPFVFLSAGLFIFVINAFLVWFAKYALDVLAFEGVSILIKGGLLTYMIAALLISVFNLITGWLLKK